ncbi:MAG: F0F1 ATP synthase subunit B [Verrucomicrobiales bacterium]
MFFLATISEDVAEIAEKFGFHPQIFISQVVSFLLVAALLYKFAYGPVQAMLEERRRTIEEGQKNAAEMRDQLAEAQKKISEMLGEANGKAEAMLSEAKDSAHAIAERERQATISEAAAILEKAREASVLERDSMMRELKGEVGRLVVATTAKVIGKELTPADQERLTRETASQIGA